MFYSLLCSINPLFLFRCSFLLFFFFFNDTATTEIYTLSLHDALPICRTRARPWKRPCGLWMTWCDRSEEHTSELQSPKDLVCRLLLEKKKDILKTATPEKWRRARVVFQSTDAGN